MAEIMMSGSIFLIFWLIFVYSFNRDRSRYRNCNLLFLALLALILFLLNLAGPFFREAALIIGILILIGLLVAPFFLIHNGIVMIRKEGHSLPHLLSLVLGIVILIGELSFIFVELGISNSYSHEATQKFCIPLRLSSAPFSASPSSMAQ